MLKSILAAVIIIPAALAAFNVLAIMLAAAPIATAAMLLVNVVVGVLFIRELLRRDQD